MFNKNKECKHHFEARYTEEFHNPGFSSIKGCFPEDLKKLMTYKKYIYDICTKCGKVINNGN